MKPFHFLLLPALTLCVYAAPTEERALVVPTILNPEAPTYSAVEGNADASRFSCGQYKFDDGTVQEFYSQVWAGHPADQRICRFFKYEFRNKKGQDGKMVAAKVDAGCTCFFYEKPCDPSAGHAEAWVGWMGWENYAYTDKKFKGWYCAE